MIKKILILFFISLSFSHHLNAQSKTDIEDVFKMQLFLNRKNVVFRTMDTSIVRNDSLYYSFKDLISLKIDTLKLENNLSFLEEDYKFYRVQETGINYNRKLASDEFRYLNIGCWMNGSYIIALNQTSGISYRLMGFDNNDFLGFFSDFKEMYRKSNVKKLKVSNFFKNYKVEDLDFRCLYNGLRSKEINLEKYPCLKKCSDTFSMHQFNKK